jgi:hypothetical protein
MEDLRGPTSSFSNPAASETSYGTPSSFSDPASDQVTSLPF